ncbi:MAG: hypothetical protein Q8922_12785 [Bacteroidota bacterium]|nr:hypothetical protein [Bacteroidota bacterium]MDP4234491.1 hypothetical protein [Bacteroidota bacterium]MDP4243859.1 hypothetical protein [Bacteroidota bacterium]MDP4288801.1 hypothetical protein [Bacteroidota bacterium]
MGHSKTKLVAAMLLLSILAVRGIHAQPGHPSIATTPRTLSYQGVLRPTDVNGKEAAPIIGDRLLTISLYADENGTARLWQRTMMVTVGPDGVFSVQLGTPDNPLPETQALDRPLWLGVAIDGGTEMRPLAQVTASAYALNVADNAVTTAKLADGAVTAAKLATDYIAGINVDGYRLTGHGSILNLHSADDLSLRYDSATSSLTIGHPQASFIGYQPAVSPNTDDGTFGPSNPASTNSVVGGTNNEAWDRPLGAPETNGHDFVGGGANNKAWGNYDAIAGGDTNVIIGDTSFIGGGQANHVDANFGSVVGGLGNHISGTGPLGFIGGGDSNKVTSNGGIVVGGHHNIVDGWPNADGAILGGANNLLNGASASIAGGDSNHVDDSAPNSFIGAGHVNTATRWGHSGIVAGDSNYAYGSKAFIGAGMANRNLGNMAAIAAGYHGWIDSTATNAFIGAGNYDSIGPTGGSSFIGGGTLNRVYGLNAAVVAGTTGGINGIGNVAYADASGIVAGRSNATTGASSFVGSGANDSVAANGAAIIAGEFNTIANGSINSLIATGYQNKIDSASPYSAITSGFSNRILGADATHAAGSPAAFIGAGNANSIAQGSDNSFIGAGTTNSLSQGSYNSSIVSGEQNIIASGDCVIAGGDTNSIFVGSEHSVIAGGSSNAIYEYNPYSMIGGGGHNSIASVYASITGGKNNAIDYASGYSFIGGGQDNWIQNYYRFSAIIAGHNNTISTINSSLGRSNFIGAGENNIIDGAGVDFAADPAFASAIVAGVFDTIDEAYSFIGAGQNNRSEDDGDFIGAGDSNRLIGGSENAIVAGRGNSANLSLTTALANGLGSAFIGAGDSNVINSTGVMAAIPAGDHLTAQSYAQTVIGAYNVPAGSVAYQSRLDYAHGGTAMDAPIFAIGNGSAVGGTSNAGEWSYDGHSVVFDQNDNSHVVLGTPGRYPIYGATYNDNTILAWGDVSAGGLVNDDFGVAYVTNPSAGVYVVRPSTQLPDARGLQQFAHGSVTVTINDDADSTVAVGTCGYATASHLISAAPYTMFIVRTYSGSGSAHICTDADLPFFFKVCARP